VDSFGQDTEAIAREARAVGIRASVGCPIVVGGRLWGVVAASRKREEPRAVQTGVPAELDQVAAGLDGALEELREFARGIHPAILTEGGLGAALRTLARRSLLPVQVEVRTQGRLPDPWVGPGRAEGPVEALGGRISVESPRGAGPAVEVELPPTADATVSSSQPVPPERG
jgi:hypothetical protein